MLRRAAKPLNICSILEKKSSEGAAYRDEGLKLTYEYFKKVVKVD